MSDPYKEATRGQGKSGLSPVGWFLVVTFSFLVLGAVGVAGVGIYVAKTASAYIADFREDPVEAFVDLAAAVDEEVEVVSRNDEDKTVTLRIRDTDDVVTVDLSDLPKMLGGSGQGRAAEQLADGVEFDGEADETGGVLTVRTSEGETRIELRGDDEGGFLKITTPDDEIHLGAGGEARSLPRWVPVYPGAKVEKRLFSADTEEGRVGAAILSIDGDDPEEVLEWYEDTMPDEGFVASATRMHTDDGEFRGKIEWTNHRGDDEREVSVAVGWDDDEDGFLFLFYRDER